MNKEKLDRFLEDMPKRGIPECELIVTEKGKEIYRKTVGREDPERNINFVCSISKITTCVAAMRLVEEGKIGLDDPVSRYLPAFEHLTVKESDGTVRPAKTVLTVRHLFTMTGGFNYNIETAALLRVREDPHADTLTVVNALAETPLDADPGDRYCYSLCHDILAAVVEVASGVRFADYVKKTILDPLGMKETGYHIPEELKPRVARQYRYDNTAFSVKEITPGCRYILTEEYDCGGAGLYTNANDQIKLLTVLANGGKTGDGYVLLKPETIAMMEKGQLDPQKKRTFFSTRLYGYNWGLCCRVHEDPVISGGLSPIGEFGWDGAAGAYALVDRKNGIALYYGMHVMNCQYGYHYLHGQIRNLVYEEA